MKYGASKHALLLHVTTYRDTTTKTICLPHFLYLEMLNVVAVKRRISLPLESGQWLIYIPGLCRPIREDSATAGW